jgi:hypothetical protein
MRFVLPDGIQRLFRLVVLRVFTPFVDRFVSLQRRNHKFV